ncbi:MAG: exported hypothetical protein [Edafosvirus sp.]|uniref:Uncharacterized protein n=1 Tax=Edafosvirus sp. TaxID=2487765 RepID=A0A3G4ZWF2_9VIRU|nr:MAG: exported hypothetical protein [Edafosvirus sp.]
MPKDSCHSKCDVCCPDVSDKILNIHFSIQNTEDLGNCGYWAVDFLNVHLLAWKLPDNQIYCSAKIIGTWKTITGALVPENNPPICNILQAGNAQGHIKAFLNGKFPIGTSVTIKKKCGNIGCIDFNGSYDDLLILPPNKQVGTQRLTDYISSLFSAPMTVLVVSASYYFNDQLLWVDTSNGSVGNVVINSNGCPS